MKKKYIISGSGITICVIILCAFTINKNMDITETVTLEEQIPTAVSRTGGKVLVTYFSVPETDGVDASSGASRLVSDGKLQGNPVATFLK